MNRLVFSLVAIISVAIGLLVGAFNPNKVTLDLLWIQLDWPLGLLVLLFLAIGILSGIFLTYLSQVIPLRIKLRKSRTELSKSKSADVVTTDD